MLFKVSHLFRSLISVSFISNTAKAKGVKLCKFLVLQSNRSVFLLFKTSHRLFFQLKSVV